MKKIHFTPVTFKTKSNNFLWWKFKMSAAEWEPICWHLNVIKISQPSECTEMETNLLSQRVRCKNHRIRTDLCSDLNLERWTPLFSYVIPQSATETSNDVDVSAQDCSISSASSMEILQSCTEPPMFGKETFYFSKWECHFQEHFL